MPEPITFSLWTVDPQVAAAADAAGVDRIGIDLDVHGKAARQSGHDTRISAHRAEQLVALPLRRARRFVRINPLHDGSAIEIDQVLGSGAEVVMLPMVSSASDAAKFVRLLGARARPVLLVEHGDGLAAIDDILRVEGVGEIHVGLNDLALSLRLKNRWLALCGNQLREAGQRVRAAGLRFGLGGVARVDDTSLPFPPDLMYAQLVRCGANATLLARSFVVGDVGLGAAVDSARARLAYWQQAGNVAVEAAHAELEALAPHMSTW